MPSNPHKVQCEVKSQYKGWGTPSCRVLEVYDHYRGTKFSSDPVLKVKLDVPLIGNNVKIRWSWITCGKDEFLAEYFGDNIFEKDCWLFGAGSPQMLSHATKYIQQHRERHGEPEFDPNSLREQSFEVSEHEQANFPDKDFNKFTPPRPPSASLMKSTPSARKLSLRSTESTRSQSSESGQPTTNSTKMKQRRTSQTSASSGGSDGDGSRPERRRSTRSKGGRRGSTSTNVRL
ncbi:hypothetical protein JCM3765_007765 [Sporobolomyces pararoseus]